MKRAFAIIAILAGVGSATVATYWWLADVRRMSYALHDAARDRDVPVQVAETNWVRLKSKLGFAPQVAIVSHGNTVRYTEYTFVGKILFAAGYKVVSIQHDLPSDPPLPQSGNPYNGRLSVYERAVANIDFVLTEMEKMEPNADYNRLTLLGHSNGGDISMYYAKMHPENVARILTMDNLRVPLLLTASSPAIMSIRSYDWKPDPGVVPDDEKCQEAGIEIVSTGFQHVQMSDRGPEGVKETLAKEIKRFLGPKAAVQPGTKTIKFDWQP
jgi:hypothetical protein